MNSHGVKLSTRTSAFHQLFHQRQQPTPRNSTADQVSRKSFHQLFYNLSTTTSLHLLTAKNQNDDTYQKLRTSKEKGTGNA